MRAFAPPGTARKNPGRRTGYDQLVGDADESPVVKNENQYRVSIGVSYMF